MNPASLVLNAVLSASDPNYAISLLEGINIVSSAAMSGYRGEMNSHGSSANGPIEIDAMPATLLKQIDLACSDPDNFEDGETRPSDVSVRSLKRFLGDSAEALGFEVPIGDISFFSGEINITWRNGNRMLRLTSFSDSRSLRIDFGTAPALSLGDYRYDAHVSVDVFAEKLISLSASAAGL